METIKIAIAEKNIFRIPLRSESDTRGGLHTDPCWKTMVLLDRCYVFIASDNADIPSHESAKFDCYQFVFWTFRFWCGIVCGYRRR